VDGSHAHDYVIADTDTALRLVAHKGWSCGTTTVYGKASPALSRDRGKPSSRPAAQSAARVWWCGRTASRARRQAAEHVGGEAAASRQDPHH
jgi:hypothetical protein